VVSAKTELGKDRKNRHALVGTENLSFLRGVATLKNATIRRRRSKKRNTLDTDDSNNGKKHFACDNHPRPYVLVVKPCRTVLRAKANHQGSHQLEIGSRCT
jgi:hypothetical protein